MDRKLKRIIKSIDKWVDANNGDVTFIGNFIVFDKDNEAKDESFYAAYGVKDVVFTMLDEMLKEVKEEKDDFINW